MDIWQPQAAPPIVFGGAADGGPYVDATPIDIAAVLTRATIESVGPTGSGADHVWTALDSVPAGADWLAINLILSFGNAGNSAGGLLWARRPGGTASMSQGIDSSVVSKFLGLPHATIDHQVVSFTGIPVDENGIVELRWDRFNAGNRTQIIKLVLRGYGVNGAL